MNRVYTTGETVLVIKPHSKDYSTKHYYISILSCRAVRHILRRSIEGTWSKPVCRLIPEIKVSQFVIVGFQPDTGLHIGYKGG